MVDNAEKSVHFIVTFHFHQPIDNYNWVFSDVYEKCYSLLLDQMIAHPLIKFTLHFTGSLLDWYEANLPEFIDKVKLLASRGQIEIIGGGYYEPIFAIIPPRDRLRQMELLRDRIKELFGVMVQGAWLSERVWEPSYPKFIADAGLKYVIVDDNHLRSMGFAEEDTFYCYATEDEGAVIRVFPINEPIRYLAPWQSAWKLMGYLRTTPSATGDRVVVFLSDAEKMGVWGTTNELCYIKGHPDDQYVGFIPAFFDHLEWNLQNQGWLKTTTPSEYIARHSARSLVYLPTATYDRMEQWVLPTPRRRMFEAALKDPRWDPVKVLFKAGFWRNFLVKYPEAGNMHKKMLHVREKLIALEQASRPSLDINKAWKEIYMAQANDVYWHGQFGGVYYKVFRHSVYYHLLQAEKFMDRVAENLGQKCPKIFQYPRAYSTDFLKDTQSEVLVETRNFNWYFKPQDGGVIFELDYKPAARNLLALMSRSEESYHDPRKIILDQFRKSAFRDRILPQNALLTKYSKEKLRDRGNFAGGLYSAEWSIMGDLVQVIFRRNGVVKVPDTPDPVPLALAKTFLHTDDTHEFEVRYSATLPDDTAENRSLLEPFVLCVDQPFLLSGDAGQAKYITNTETFRYKNMRKLCTPLLQVQDATWGLEIDYTFPEGADQTWVYPVNTYAVDNNKWVREYQGTNVVTRIPLTVLLNKDQVFTFACHLLKQE